MAGTALALATVPQPLVGMKGGHWHHRQDWHLTSSGVGLEYQPPLPFLPPAAQSTLHQPLPLASEQLWKEGDTKHLATTTVLCHKVKTHGGVLSQPHHPIPPPHWQVHFNKDLQDKLHLHTWQFPLAAAYLVSEMQECFPGWPSLAPNGARLPGAQVPCLVDHHCDGPSKQVVPTTQNPALAGRLFYLQEEGALHQLEPYASVPARDFRPFSQKELQCLTHKRAGGLPLPFPYPPCDRAPCSLRLPMETPAMTHRGALSLAHESFGVQWWAPTCLGPRQRQPTVCLQAALPKVLAAHGMYCAEA
ncbi:stabilizer of axonemal microtubules 3 isoform X2 [Alligator mississippiensis]|uniref:stabilizer of axonemal microtubules 3 isoform X2 n=1 Tax=Alligator mississippiensis TaxID=8496 RepID=UPI0028778603|nr:stabilizer of axonemal microtubules 3 isoform X2 [Alligator mississippiensis]